MDIQFRSPIRCRLCNRRFNYVPKVCDQPLCGLSTRVYNVRMDKNLNNPVSEVTLKEFKDEILESKLRTVQPGDEVGTLRVSRLAAAQAAAFYRLADPGFQE